MRKVLVDNWFMEQVASDEQLDIKDRSNAYFEFLNAIILWDEIYYPDNDRTWWKNLPGDLQSFVKPIELPPEYETMELFDHAEKAITCLEGENGKLDSQTRALIQEVANKTTRIVGNEALGYLWVSSENDCDYLPHSKRKKFIKEALPRLKDFFIRNAVMDLVDEKVQKNYLSKYNEYELNLLKYEMPVLSRMVIENLPSGFSPIDYAMHIKNEGPVERYRNYCSEMEYYFKIKDKDKYIKKRNEIADVIDEAIAASEKSSLASLASLASLSVNVLPIGSLGVGINAPPIKSDKLVFLNDLVSFAKSNPPLKYW